MFNKRLMAFVASLFLVGSAYAGVPKTYPDFTVTDLKGKSYHLFDLLSQGKWVYLSFAATW